MSSKKDTYRHFDANDEPNNSFNRTRLKASFHDLFDLELCGFRSPVNSGVRLLLQT